MKKFLFLGFLTFLSLVTKAERSPDGGNIFSQTSGLGHHILDSAPIVLGIGVLLCCAGAALWKYGFPNVQMKHGYNKEWYPGGGGGEKKEEKK